MPTREQLESALVNADKAGDVDAAKQLANALKNYQEDSSAMDYAGAAASGVNALVPAIAGLPMDTATSLANLGIAGYGAAKGALGLGGEAGEDLPEAIPPQIGGSKWIREKMAKTLGTDPFSPPDPSDPTQQNIHMASGIMGAGLLSPATGVKQMAGNVARMTPSAAGAVTAKEMFPDEPLAPIAGMMVAPGAIQAVKSIPKASVSKAFVKAHKLGYKVPPVLAKPSKTQQFAEGTAGPVPTKQKASIHNQKITNDLIKKDLGYPVEHPLSTEGLQAIRSQAGEVYKSATNLGKFRVDKAFNSEISKIAKQGSALSREFPGLVKKDVIKMVKGFQGKKEISSEALVNAVKQLRADSSVGFKSQDPSTLALAKANGKMANALEGLMERNIKVTKPEFLNDFKAARQRIAKTYTVEKSLKGENVDAVALGRELDKGKPLSGTIKDVAEFGQNFKGAAQTNVPQSGNFRPMDLVVGGGGAVATGNPAYLAAMGARPALRTLLLSKPYQKMLARVKPEAINKIIGLPEQAQAGALASLLDEFNQDSPE